MIVINKYLFTVVVLFGCLHPLFSQSKERKIQLDSFEHKKFIPWQEGYLDIHHINTGQGDTSFMIFPDGTSMLFDIGKLDKKKFERKYYPLKATASVPSDSLSPAEWTARYIRIMHPKKENAELDYVLISHFHGDHYGSLTDLSRLIKINKIIDRNYPKYDFPLDLRTYLKNDNLFNSYLKLVSSQNAPEVESLEVGSESQIFLVNSKELYKEFKITNIKANASIWDGEDDVYEYFKPDDMIQFYKGKYNENPLSLAIKMSYGKFDYFTGGDNTGLKGFGLPYWFDVETPIAVAVGKVEATTLNHHGNRDATNQRFISSLNPKVVIQQLWCSDHPGQEVYQRLIYKDSLAEQRKIFSTNMHAETLVTYGPWFKNNYASTQGHVVIRVFPGGEEYQVFVLEEKKFKVKMATEIFKSN